MCRKQLILFVEKYDKIPYEVLNYLGAIVNYGGRVTDDKDSLLISTILKTFICDQAIVTGHGFSKSGIYKVIEPQFPLVVAKVKKLRTVSMRMLVEVAGLYS